MTAAAVEVTGTEDEVADAAADAVSLVNGDAMQDDAAEERPVVVASTCRGPGYGKTTGWRVPCGLGNQTRGVGWGRRGC